MKYELSNYDDNRVFLGPVYSMHVMPALPVFPLFLLEIILKIR